MKIVQVHFTIDSLSKEYRRREINLKPSYQRPHEGVWNLKKKQLLVDTVLRTYDMPKIYLRAVDSDSTVKYEVVDGQQRIRAMWDFIDGKFELGEASADLPAPIGDLAGKEYGSLDSETKDRFGAFSLSIFEIQQADEEEIPRTISTPPGGHIPESRRTSQCNDGRHARLRGCDSRKRPWNCSPRRTPTYASDIQAPPMG